jgi:Flp pilus assembly protein TadD
MIRIERLAPSRPATWIGAMLLLVLSGCSTTKSNYPGATEQLQQQKSDAVNDSAATYLRLVEQMQRDGLWFASLAHIDALEQRWGASPDSTRMRADALRRTDQADASQRLYAQLMGTPLEAAGYRGLGLLAGSKGDYAQAVRMLEQAQRRTPTDGLLLSDLGYAQMRAGHLAQARVPLMQALQLAPDNTQVQVNAALYFQASGQPAQAEALMDANKMPETTRTAIQQAALALPVPYAVVPAADLPAPTPDISASVASASASITAATSEAARPQLALKTSPWPRRVHVLVRPQAEPTALAAAGATEPLSPLPSTGAQP